MEEILEEVKKYDMTELRAKLKEIGVLVGPIATSTKFLFQKRLANEIFRRRGGVQTDETNEAENESKPEVKELEKNNAEPKGVPGVYYAVCLPEDTNTENAEVTKLVFSVKDEALKTAKKFKGSRFKVFKSEEEAHLFAQLKAETSIQTPLKEEEKNGKDSQVSSESSPYKAPKPQDLTKLRRVIENGEAKLFKETVWENPRYLVGSGDTPTIYQEGPRYSAMHIASLKNKPEMCQTLLDILEDPQFVNRLYCHSKNTEETQNSRINFLVDLYLNMPDKGNCDAPLHMACKFGLDKVVEVLAAHPKTDRFLRNKWGETPKDVICSRCPNAAHTTKQRIELLLQGQCFVPLIRSDDNCTLPIIGQPWSPDVNKSPLDVPQKSWSPRDSSLSIKACAGPMSPSDADKFHRLWTTPPSQSPDQAKKYFHTKRSDSEKGLERIGRQIAQELKVSWSEYWEFLDKFEDLSSESGLDTLEEYFKKRIWLLYIKQYQEKYVLNETVTDYGSCSTPLRGRENISEEEEKEKFHDSVFEKSPDDKSTEDGSDNGCHGNKAEINVVSPMTGLSMSMAKLRLFDDSWSDKATVNSSRNLEDESEDAVSAVSVDEKAKCDDIMNTSDEKEEELNEKPLENKGEKTKDGNSDDNGFDDLAVENAEEPKDAVECEEKKESVEINQGKNQVDNETDKDSVDCEKVGAKDSQEDPKTDKGETSSVVKDPISDDYKVKENNDLKVSDNDSSDKKDQNDNKKASVIKKVYERSISDSSGSVSSFVTAAEEVETEHAVIKELTDLSSFLVCLRISQEVFKKMKSIQTEEEEPNVESATKAETNKFLVRLKSWSNGSVEKIDVVSFPKMDSANSIMVIGDVEVTGSEGDVGRVEEGGLVEIKCEALEDEKQSDVKGIQAYVTRVVTLPKAGYIHGPQPTREDLDVSRALCNTVISPDRHPLVFSWKISLSRFLKDTNYRWQSPAKLRTRLRQSSPLSPQRKPSPVIPYGSPLGLRTQPRNTLRTSDIRANLFPSVLE